MSASTTRGPSAPSARAAPHVLLAFRRFCREVARVLRAALGGHPKLWVSTQLWIPAAGTVVHAPVAVGDGPPPYDGLATRPPLLVVTHTAAPDGETVAVAGHVGTVRWHVGAEDVTVVGPGSAAPPVTVVAGGVLAIPGVPAGTAGVPVDTLVMLAAQLWPRPPRRPRDAELLLDSPGPTGVP